MRICRCSKTWDWFTIGHSGIFSGHFQMKLNLTLNNEIICFLFLVYEQGDVKIHGLDGATNVFIKKVSLN
jgi:hypothetical protein